MDFEASERRLLDPVLTLPITNDNHSADNDLGLESFRGALETYKFALILGFIIDGTINSSSIGCPGRINRWAFLAFFPSIRKLQQIQAATVPSDILLSDKT